MDEYAGGSSFLLSFYNMKLKQNETMLKGLLMLLRDLKKQYEIKETAELHKDIATVNEIINTATEAHKKGYPWILENLNKVSDTVEPIRNRHL